ncbi:putative F-box protein At1g32420 [Daucus carota subsp. sativus]|uniref:putative F-box protein At1g32420 n=1 Tax=Daucus carota subsp. sativus TaxID=79200 RepID=UPI0007EFEED7|nr:PREDICTED: putative F-box protein At1g32420 [Daucus carota subsp. sativus]
MSNLPDDLWFQIFLRLSLKDLLSSKCVCKSWLSNISSRRFVTDHLRLSISSGEDDETLIVHHNSVFLELQGVGPFSLAHLTSGGVLEQLDYPYSEGYYSSRPTSCRILGSDCGIVCVLVEHGRGYDIYLWNPATKLSKLVPSQAEGRPLKRQIIGFGFDQKDFDCKVVEVVSASTSVYSSNRNSWRKMFPIKQILPIDVPFELALEVCLHGFLLTMGHKGMMAFDLNKEVFIYNIKLPTVDPEGTCIAEYYGSIAVMMLCEQSEKKVKLWTLDDEACLSGGGVEASWTMKLSFDVGDQHFYRPRGLFNSVEFLLVDHNYNRFLYNPYRQAPANLRPTTSWKIFNHTKSLFPIAGSEPVKWTNSLWRQLQLERDYIVEKDEESI